MKENEEEMKECRKNKRMRRVNKGYEEQMKGCERKRRDVMRK
jgi:hypothetical protein